MADTADKPNQTPPPDPKTDPPAKPDTGKPPANPNPQPQPTNPPAPAFMTADQVKEIVAAERKAWETEHVAKLEQGFRDNYEIPKRRDGKIAHLRQELKGAGKYLAADDDVSDPTFPGDLAALADLDDSTPVPGAKSKDGKPLTRLDIELNRTRARLMKRDAKKVGGDALGTPPLEPDGDDLDAQAEEVRKEREARRAARPTLQDIYGGLAPSSRR